MRAGVWSRSKIRAGGATETLTGVRWDGASQFISPRSGLAPRPTSIEHCHGHRLQPLSPVTTPRPPHDPRPCLLSPSPTLASSACELRLADSSPRSLPWRCPQSAVQGPRPSTTAPLVALAVAPCQRPPEPPPRARDNNFPPTVAAPACPPLPPSSRLYIVLSPSLSLDAAPDHSPPIATLPRLDHSVCTIAA